MNASDKQVPHHSQPKGTAAEGLQRWAMMTEILSCLPVLPSGGRTRYDCLVKNTLSPQIHQLTLQHPVPRTQSQSS